VVDDLACDGVFVKHIRDLPDAGLGGCCLFAEGLAVLKVSFAVVLNAYGAAPLLLVCRCLWGQARGVARGVKGVVIWAGTVNRKGSAHQHTALWPVLWYSPG
jgi:hypothetical protein